MADPDLRVRVALDDDPGEPDPAWTDITDRVHYGDGGREVSVQIGRQNEQVDVKPTELSWAVRNGDDMFTPNNSLSPLAGRWEQGRRCQIAEVLDGEEFVLGTGFLEIPEMSIVDSKSSQPVTVTAIDRMGRLENAPDFDGTLAEAIRAQPGMVEWFPLSDPTGTDIWQSALTSARAIRYIEGFLSEPVPAEPADLLRPANADGPPGDDQKYAQWTPIGDAQGDAFLGRGWLVAPVDITVAADEVVALSAWVRADAWTVAAGTTQPYANIAYLLKTVTGVPQVDLVDGTLVRSKSLNGTRRLERDVWRLVTSRLDFNAGTMNLWCGADMAVSGSFSSGTGTFNELRIGELFVGAIAHVQVRVGDATIMTYADHLAQHEHGWRGLQRQTVAERIVTLAGYAGVAAADIDVSAAASTPMQVAKLAGVNPATALRATATTGQDTLSTSGPGRLTVVPRSQRYNQPVSMQIPFGWIGWRGLRYRPDKPVTTVTVTRTGGGSTRRHDAALATRYGVTSLPYELDTAIDADVPNLADWALAAHGVSRTRAPSIRLNMLKRTTIERKHLLRLNVGDRIEIVDLPAGSPHDVGDLIVQGIRHTAGPGNRRWIELRTSPLLGPTPGAAPACPTVGDLVSTTAIVAY